MLDLPLRVLLMVALVLWSPAWCCCALKATVSAELTVEASVAGPCTGRWGAVQRDRNIASSLPPCCAARMASPDDETDDVEEPGCNCHERPDELNRLDTASKVIMPLLRHMDLALVTIHLSGDELTEQFPIPSISDGCVNTLVSQRSLLAQRCMLLI